MFEQVSDAENSRFEKFLSLDYYLPLMKKILLVSITRKKGKQGKTIVLPSTFVLLGNVAY